MIGTLYTAFLRSLIGLSRRERAMLVALCAVVVPLGIAYGLVLPTLRAGQETRAALADAQDLRAFVEDQAERHAGLLAGPATAPAPIGPPIGVSGIEESLVQADLRGDVTRLANQADGGVSLGFDAVRFGALTDWLTEVGPGWGYEMTTFTLTRGDKPDTVAADFTLEPRK